MIFIIKVFRKILGIKYAIIKAFPMQDKVSIVSRQSNYKTMDIEMLEKELKRQSPKSKVRVLCRTTGDSLPSKVGYCFHLVRQMWHVGTSRIVVLDSYCISVSMFKQREELKVVQMWHALGALKKFGLSIVGNEGEGRNEKVAKAMNIHGNYTDIIVSSDRCKEVYQEAFGYDASHIKVASLPRVDKILDKDFKEDVKDKIYTRYPEFRDKKLIVYAPTFRAKRNIDKEIQLLINEIEKEKYILVIKKHPLMDIRCDHHKNVVVDEAFSTMEMMMIGDYIICDYSAVVFEGALMRKPLFFYAPDLEEYITDRTFYMDYKREIPGVVSKDPKEIMIAISNNEFNMERITKFANDYVEVQEHCTKQLAKILLN